MKKTAVRKSGYLEEYKMKTGFQWLFFVGLFFGCISNASAHGYALDFTPKKDYSLSIGPSVAYVYKNGSGVCANLDTSFTWRMFSASLNLKYLREVVSKHNIFGPQLELTAWFFVAAGGGGGYLFGDENGPVLNVFVGVPIPLFGDFRRAIQSRSDFFNTAFLHPYYRANFFFSDDYVVFHEVGIFFKLSSFDL